VSRTRAADYIRRALADLREAEVGPQDRPAHAVAVRELEQLVVTLDRRSNSESDRKRRNRAQLSLVVHDQGVEDVPPGAAGTERRAAR